MNNCEVQGGCTHQSLGPQIQGVGLAGLHCSTPRVAWAQGDGAVQWDRLGQRVHPGLLQEKPAQVFQRLGRWYQARLALGKASPSLTGRGRQGILPAPWAFFIPVSEVQWGQGQGSLLWCSHHSWNYLNTFTSTMSTGSILVGGHIKPPSPMPPQGCPCQGLAKEETGHKLQTPSLV